MEEDEDDPVYMARFKKDLKDDLHERLESNLNKKVLAKASYFDKRFANLKFIEKDEKEDVMEEIKSELREIEKEAKEILNKKDDSDKQPKNKKRFLGAGGLCDSSDDDETDNVEIEMKNYEAERRLKSDGNPFEWWKQRKNCYPLMAKMARKYLAVQGTSTPAERVISRLGAILTKRRQSMSGELFSEIMFLSDTI